MLPSFIVTRSPFTTLHYGTAARSAAFTAQKLLQLGPSPSGGSRRDRDGTINRHV